MNKLDLRQVGTILGLPLYVDVAGVRESVQQKTPNSKLVIGERDRKTAMVQNLLQKMFASPLEKKS